MAVEKVAFLMECYSIQMHMPKLETKDPRILCTTQ